MWFGTNEGLNKYDGYTIITNYKKFVSTHVKGYCEAAEAANCLVAVLRHHDESRCCYKLVKAPCFSMVGWHGVEPFS
ncbi:hypothetical protein JW960_05635, partial [candidate division KSB1 bacterium]|nr:hypothetical protein [candidate division KSB1 bacterium]